MAALISAYLWVAHVIAKLQAWDVIDGYRIPRSVFNEWWIQMKSIKHTVR